MASVTAEQLPDGLRSLEAYSGCIEAIYDCALDPERWPAALERISALLHGVCGVLVLAEPHAGVTRFHRSWNLDEESSRLFYAEYSADNPLTPLFNRFDVDQPYNIAAVLERGQWEASRIFREFGEPRGFRDCVGVTLLKVPLRFASLWIATPEVDLTGPRELRIMQLVAPHARRALAIGDMIDMRTLMAESLEAALDMLAPAVVLVGGNGNPVFANASARHKDGLRPPLTLVGGRVGLSDRLADAALQRALEEARRGSARPLTLGARGEDGAVAFVYALPIGRDGMRARLEPSAAYALFVTPVPHALARDAWVGAFRLTEAETAVLEKLVAGLTPGEAAAELGTALPTVRTHMAGLFRKTGTGRQADLVRLAASLQPPVRGDA